MINFASKMFKTKVDNVFSIDNNKKYHNINKNLACFCEIKNVTGPHFCRQEYLSGTDACGCLDGGAARRKHRRRAQVQSTARIRTLRADRLLFCAEPGCNGRWSRKRRFVGNDSGCSYTARRSYTAGGGSLSSSGGSSTGTPFFPTALRDACRFPSGRRKHQFWCNLGHFPAVTPLLYPAVGRLKYGPV